MALRNQPYIPLYIQDYLTDEKLSICSWATQGIYIKIMCILHKQNEYGQLLFKQSFKQSESMITNFAFMLVKYLPCQLSEMESALIELIENDVLQINGNYLQQKRMVKDNAISIARSKAGKKGGGNPNLFKQNDIQNTENENVNVNEVINKDDTENIKTFSFAKALIEIGAKKEVVDAFMQVRKKRNAVNSEYAFTLLANQIKKSGHDINLVLEECILRNWQSFKADWEITKSKPEPVSPYKKAEQC
jgi:hypothetical protein